MKRYLVTRVRTEVTTAFVYADDEDKAEDLFEDMEARGEVTWDEHSDTEIEEHNE